MRGKVIYILTCVVSVLLCCGCSDEQVLNSNEPVLDPYEKEVKQVEDDQVPLSFTPSVGTYSNEEEEATTRADRNYLTNVSSTATNYNSFPYFESTDPNDLSIGTGSHVGALSPYLDYRKGSFANNSYIVGIYGFYDHNWSTDTSIPWSTLKDDSNLTANFMTNQPLLHTDASTWEYSPLRYWPNSKMSEGSTDATPVKVTFVSYYPFQDFKRGDPQGSLTDKEYYVTQSPYPYYRCGQTIDEVKYADLTCIEPPAKGATGKDAYTFTFTQKEKPEEQIDFLLGIDADKTKQPVTEATTKANGINLNLHHTLCAVIFEIKALTGAIPSGFEITINSLKLEGLYGKGKVRPITDPPYIEWSDLENGDSSYTLEFTGAEEDFHSSVTGITKPVFGPNPSNEVRLSQGTIYENVKGKSRGTYDKSDDKWVPNARGMKFLMLVIPQKVTERDAYLVINYDMSYSTTDPNTPNIVYKNCEEKIKLYDDKKLKGNTDQLFNAGKTIIFNVQIRSPKEILMDVAVEEDWGDDLRRDVTLPEPGDLSLEEFSFNPTRYTVTSSDLETVNAGKPTLLHTKNAQSLTVEYSSTDPTVATINATTGAFESIGVNGETTIVAKITGMSAPYDVYNGKSVSYTLVVDKPRAVISNAELSYPVETFTVTKDKIILPTLTNTKDLPITFSSSDKTVATVRKQTGVVTIVANGIAVISATFAGDKDYAAKTVSYTLTVNKPVFKYSTRFYTVSSVADEATLPTLSHESIADGDITYTSSNTSVATVAADGTVTVVDNGVTNIVATFAGNTDFNAKTAVYTLTVNKP